MVYMKLDAETLEPIWVNAAPITGANGEIYMTSVKVDASGNLILAGTMTSVGTVDFGNGVNMTTPTPSSSRAWIAKVDSEGVAQWAEQYPGTSRNGGFDMDVDGAGNIYMV